MTVLKFLATTTLCVLANFCFGQDQTFTYSDRGLVSIGAKLALQSEILGEDREIIVSLPQNYDASSKRYPVIYLLDAQYFFEFQYAYGLISTLTFFEEMPESILVGIVSADRTKDMIPSSQNSEGGAETFLQFIRMELQPFIDQKYRTEPYDILIGHSDSGLFALHTLFQAPETFNAYVAISPAVWGDDGQFVETLKRTLAENRAFKNSLFTSLASEGGDQRETYDSFVGMIREANIEGLEFSNAYFLEEDHGSTIMPAMREGLLTVYTDWGPPDSVSRLEQLLSHYRNLSKRYGYAIPVPVRHASNAGFNLIRNGDPAAALEIFEYSLSNISQDAIGHYQVAVALQRLGRLSEALSQYEQAIELGSGTDMYPVFVSRRDEVAQEIREQEVSE